jgi:hypothetical protein
LWRKYKRCQWILKIDGTTNQTWKVSKKRRIYIICGQCNKSRHSKEHCHWKPNNPNNKFKDKKEVAMNGVSAQLGGTRNKSGNKGG